MKKKRPCPCTHRLLASFRSCFGQGRFKLSQPPSPERGRIKFRIGTFFDCRPQNAVRFSRILCFPVASGQSSVHEALLLCFTVIVTLTVVIFQLMLDLQLSLVGLIRRKFCNFSFHTNESFVHVYYISGGYLPLKLLSWKTCVYMLVYVPPEFLYIK